MSIATDHSDHHDHPNHVAIFAGITTGGDDDNHGEEDAALTVGLDYERRLSDLLASAFLEGSELGYLGVCVTLFKYVNFDVASTVESTKISGTTLPRGLILNLGVEISF